MELIKEVEGGHLKESSTAYSYLFQSQRALDEVLEGNKLYAEELTRLSDKLIGGAKVVSL